MSALAEHAHNYLTVRRALGFKLVGEGQLLRRLRRVLPRRRGQRTITTQFALEWARRPASGSRNYLSRRLRAVRAFARYLHALDPACESPADRAAARQQASAGAVPLSRRGDHRVDGGRRRASPAAARRDVPDADRAAGVHRAADRRSDPPGPRGLRLDPRAVWSVRDSKFGKSREVLLHASAVGALVDYGERPRPALSRRRRSAASSSPPAAPGSATPPSMCRSGRCSTRPASGTTRRHDASVYMICATVSPSRRCLAGIATVVTSPRGCRCCPRIWGMWTRRDLLVSVRGTGAASPRRRASGAGHRRTVDDRARSDAGGVLHLSADRQRKASARTRSPPTATPSGCCSASPSSAPASSRRKLDDRGSRRAADHRVPRPPRARARQQPAHPQRPPGGDPLDVPLRRAAPPRARCADRARDRGPDQALRPRDRHLPHPGRGQRAARRARPRPLDRPPRPRTADRRDPDRTARHRAHQPPLPGRAPRHRRRTSRPPGRAANNAPRR